MLSSLSDAAATLQLEKNFFHRICCHSATSLPKPLWFRHIAVVAARWEVAAKPSPASPTPSPSPIGRGAAAHRGGDEPHPQPLPDREGGGCAQGGDGRISDIK